jgi:hypothetical protein
MNLQSYVKKSHIFLIINDTVDRQTERIVPRSLHVEHSAHGFPSSSDETLSNSDTTYPSQPSSSYWYIHTYIDWSIHSFWIPSILYYTTVIYHDGGH